MRYENLRLLVAGGVIVWMAGVILNFDGVVELLTSGHVTLHWSRVLAGMFFSVNLAQLLGTLCAVKILRALHLRQPFLHGEPQGSGVNR